jgi:hypothetical protein
VKKKGVHDNFPIVAKWDGHMPTAEQIAGQSAKNGNDK